MRAQAVVARRWRNGLAALIGVVVAATAIPAPAAAGDGGAPPDGKPDSQSSDNMNPTTMAIMRRQEKLQPAVQALTEQAMKLTDGGFTSVAFEGDGLALYWKGELPSTMAAALTRARTITPVAIRPAAFSKAELVAAGLRILKVGGDRNDIQTITYGRDGSALLIQKLPTATANAMALRATAPMVSAEQAVAKAAEGIPVQITTAAKANVRYGCFGACNRRDDTGPWNGGTRIWGKRVPSYATIGRCTSGFGVWVPALNNTFVLTAAHCGTWQPGGGDDFVDDTYPAELVGQAMQAEDWRSDLLLINARGMYWIFDGIPETSFHKTVHSWGYTAIDNWVCQSGAESGTVCDLKVTGYNIVSQYYVDSDGDAIRNYGLMEATQQYGRTAGTRGDSGGPVFSLDGDGVQAKGIVQGGDHATKLYFQDMDDITTAAGSWYAAYPWTA